MIGFETSPGYLKLTRSTKPKGNAMFRKVLTIVIYLVMITATMLVQTCDWNRQCSGNTDPIATGDYDLRGRKIE